ncbi:hypothetical protein [Reyranella soli]|uniref:Alkaline proteinase inhibitor/ Outer membrane lipoprotein Omp19 domain-containing protein n=1 Tax=Reyranella soli TaxID=1230389 RepID=A0A512NQJ5_9HYPH|nr:hypothetical protein [Reyranella soli]GEP61207.1 hypothetical protein RSO01_83730 [Reyranella soli]
MWRFLLLPLIVSAFQAGVAAQSIPQQTNPATAYTGTVGDWALGRWNGLAVRNTKGGSAIDTASFVLIIRKQQDGKAVCRFAPVQYADVAPWAPECTTTADSIRLLSLSGPGTASGTATGTTIRLSRTGRDGLEGNMIAAAGSSRVSFTRE